ncbi:MAG: 2-dehydropantoate 2-reductase [Rhodospirillaceae bacterium]|nr:2-dehydropantoate 2-reductase [Rhodospirillaceae bacterium]
MRILVVGAGGIGGYFGGRLLQAGRDVTFLVRPRRAAILAENGFSIQSPLGDFHDPAPPLVTADHLDAPFDLIVLSCKAYDLADAMESFAPAVGEKTLILPLLNGMAHLDDLDARFGAGHVLGGLCQISSGTDEKGGILHFNNVHNLVFGVRAGAQGQAAADLMAALDGSGFVVRQSTKIVQEMWEKWVFIAVCAGMTCLMRAAICDIIAAGGEGVIAGLFEECAEIARAAGFPPGEALMKQNQAFLLEPKSLLMASMLRDMERGAAVEADHVLGALLDRAPREDDAPLLTLAYLHLKAYEARREREDV